LYLHSRCRSTNPKLIPRVRCTGTPVGKYVDWVRNRFVEIGAYTIHEDKETKLKRLFIPANLDDNPHLQKNDPQYEARLKMQGDKIYQALRYGDWTKIEGTCFPELSVNSHLISSYVPNENDIIIRGFDYGFSAPFAAVWLAYTRDKELICFKEYVGTLNGGNKGLQLPANEVAKNILDTEKANKLNVYHCPSDVSMWNKHNQGESIAEIFESEGCIMHRANNDRIYGTQQIHMRLANLSHTGKPSLYITQDCPYTFKTMSQIQVDKKKIETYDTNGFDHCVDALRYAVCEMPIEGDAAMSPVDIFGDRISSNMPF
jgi:hypothetical protein